MSWPAYEKRLMWPDVSSIRFPGLGHQDAAVVQSLLEGAGLFFELHHGFGECPDVILIRATDLPAVKALLLEYTIRSPRDEKIPIPW
jgi:hypothetical protein